jgi:hypothetical protein
MSKTEAEFDAGYFKNLFGEATVEWHEFIAVSIRTFSEGRVKLNRAVSEKDMDAFSDSRHGIGPSLQQWGALSLERSLRELTLDQLDGNWPNIELEFEGLMAELEKLKA